MEAPAWLGTSDLIAPVGRLTGEEVSAIEAWSCEPITGGAGETIGVWRVTGEATVDGAATPFTVILKGWSVPPGADDATAWDWPHRELRAYTSGVLDDLPGGIGAPTCLGDVAAEDDSVWAWLSPMSTGALASWDLEHFALVARTLGRFNGAYLAGQPLPQADWLSRQWTRKWTEAAGDVIEHLDAFIAHPLLAQAMPPAVARELRRLWDERVRWFGTLDALPQTFCHLDAFKRNIFLRPGPGGELEPGLIDWGFAGACAIGEEIAPLVSASIVFGEAPGMTLEAMDAAVFEGYIAGLCDAGWDGDDRLVRMGYAGSLVMRYVLGPLRLTLPIVANEALHPIIERVFGVTVPEFLELGTAHTEWAFGLADEFRRLLGTVAPLPDAA